MKRLLTAIAALAALACAGTSCQKEFGQDTNNDKFTVTAVIEAGRQTKMSYEDQGLKPVWTPNTDIIIGFDENGNTYGYNVTSVSSDGKAVLEIITDGEYVGSATTNPAEGTKMYMFYAPGKRPDDISNKTLTVDISSQSAEVAPALMMSTAVVENNSLSLTFTNETVVIGIKTPAMKNPSAIYSDITLTSNVTLNNQVTFDLSGDAGALKATYSQAATSGITKAVNLTGTEASDKTIYLVACPITDADLIFTANHIGGKEVTTRTGKTLSAGNYYYINSPSFNTQRTITATLANLTDASTQPSLVNGKKVKVANGTAEPQECVLTVGASGASFVTSLTGELTVVYPADAAKMNSINDKQIDGVIVPTLQSATSLNDAIIAKATVDADASAAEFTNRTAVFKVTPPAGTTSLEVSADKDLANATVSEYTDTKKIHVYYDEMSAPTECYIATLVPDGLKLNDLTFNNGSKTKTESGTGNVAVNTLYEITSDNWQAPQRTITLSFAQATIDLFNGSTYTPAFDDSKKVKISNETASAECDITVSGGTATITTNLEGPLTAVYPSTAAKMNDTDDNIIDGVNVSTVQDGTLDANIIAAMATIAADASTAEFSNRTAVFKITPPATGTTTVDVLATVDIANDDTGTPANYKKIHVNYAPATTDYYVSILVPDGLKLGDLSFDNGGFAKKITTGVVPITVNNLYEINSSDWENTNIGGEGGSDEITTITGDGHYVEW